LYSSAIDRVVMVKKGKRKAAAATESDSDDDASGAPIPLGNASVERIDVTFDFEDVRPDHFHGIRMLLQNFSPGVSSLGEATSELADLVTSKDTASGTVITAEGEDEVFAFAIAVDLCRHKVLPT